MIARTGESEFLTTITPKRKEDILYRLSSKLEIESDFGRISGLFTQSETGSIRLKAARLVPGLVLEPGIVGNPAGGPGVDSSLGMGV